MSPYMEAWLINQSNYIIPRDDYGNKTVYLGPYTIPGLFGTDEPDKHFVLYALNIGDHGFSVGAHYGEEEYEYLSGEVFYGGDTSPHSVFGSEPILMAISRYLIHEKRGSKGGFHP